MKLRIVWFYLLFSSVQCFSQGNYRLIAHWDFNGSANDVSGNGLNGTVTGATLVSGYSGVASTAYYFNGSGDHIDVPYNSLMNVDSSFAICTLIKPMGFYSGDAQGNFILTRAAEYANDYYQIGYCDNAYDSSNSVFSPDHEVFYSSIIGGYEPPWYPGNINVQIDTWYCAVIVYTGDSVSLYLDGSKIKSLATHKIYSPGTDGIGIGYNTTRVSDFPYWINGIIDDIRLYNRSLSDAEVVQYCDSAKMSPIAATSIIKPFTGGPPQITVYPNPAHNYVTIELPYSNGENVVQLFNAVGQMITEIKTTNTVVNVNISNLPPGIFFARTSTAGQNIFRKIIKE